MGTAIPTRARKDAIAGTPYGAYTGTSSESVEYPAIGATSGIGANVNPPKAATVVVGGFPTAVVSRSGLASLMVGQCLSARDAGEDWMPKLVFSSNGQGIALAGRDQRFAQVMSHADIIHADGMPVVLASRLTRTPLPERICTTDFFHDAARAAVKEGLRFFMLGGSDELNRKVVNEIQRQYPGLQIVGRHHGYFDPEDDDAVCEMIRNSRADVVWVALGKPRQEEWSHRNREKLAGVGWIKTCGGLYSYITGEVSRAPRWMQLSGLEWAYRSAREPGRLSWRYLTTNPYAALRLVMRTHSA